MSFVNASAACSVVGRFQNLSAGLQKAHSVFPFCDVNTNANHKKSSLSFVFFAMYRFSLLRLILARDADAFFEGGDWPPSKAEQPA